MFPSSSPIVFKAGACPVCSTVRVMTSRMSRWRWVSGSVTSPPSGAGSRGQAVCACWRCLSCPARRTVVNRGAYSDVQQRSTGGSAPLPTPQRWRHPRKHPRPWLPRRWILGDRSGMVGMGRSPVGRRMPTSPKITGRRLLTIPRRTTGNRACKAAGSGCCWRVQSV